MALLEFISLQTPKFAFRLYSQNAEQPQTTGVETQNNNTPLQAETTVLLNIGSAQQLCQWQNNLWGKCLSPWPIARQ